MESKIWDMRNYSEAPLSFPKMNEIKTIFEQGGLIAIPTETVYGLGANAKDEEAVSNIYKAKGRPSDNPLIVHIHSLEQLNEFVTHIPNEAKVLMNAFWPGPISFILPLKKGYLCDKVSGGLDSIAVRMPSHTLGRAILQYVNLPIAAPSANLSGRPSPTTFQHVYHDLNGKIDGIVNGDQSEEGLESTVLDCTQYPFRIARPGAITQTMLNEVLPGSVEHFNYNNVEKPIAPGMKYKHYSPETPVTMLKDLTNPIANHKDWSNAAFIVPESLQSLVPDSSWFIPLCQDEDDIKGANHNLYAILHDIDKNEMINEAYIYAFENAESAEAVMNRMSKATANRIIRGEEL
ncbi:threonylcarbamoyl-AMP synthase [Staphylococcus pragensis]|uniref:Threonylcarbamoyl-AMP synthase n=1 Tax=Staphylococcus pragensis TaxID=1611836 RepID=A0A4Z1B0W2_9STAP|nr:MULTISPECIES: L-threonylcarbamoyladenylate synthase [Staphylococcus]RTX91669.1 threonylcarbamoyl-AMP synthase [Staphylococcus carnosus]TGN23798.1 threonylcarbamoyl-AMP synthase [Staphylococcus pragensis]GGG96287.1 threonylcarbamoyl-AMP synthase [Staphylococcus pragensis]